MNCVVGLEKVVVWVWVVEKRKLWFGLVVVLFCFVLLLGLYGYLYE